MNERSRYRSIRTDPVGKAPRGTLCGQPGPTTWLHSPSKGRWNAFHNSTPRTKSRTSSSGARCPKPSKA